MTPLNARVIIASIGTAGVAAHTAFRQMGRTWGATHAEAHQPLTGDDLVPDISSQVTMAIDIEVPPDAVWPWLMQMGVDRAGLYTHTWVENGLLRLKVRNADVIVPAWQDLKVDDHIWFVPEGYPTPRHGPRVAMIEPHRSLVCTLGDDPATCQGTWQFILRPQGPTMTRLLFRSRASINRPAATKLFDLVFEPGYLYMDIGMLHGIRTRAERAGRAQVMDLLQPEEPTMTALVAVASQQGGTRHIAMAIATELAAHNIATEVRDVAEVQDISGYDAVVIGSAIHRHRWLGEAERFVEHHGAELRARPVWLFSSGMLAVDTNAPWAADYPRDIAHLMAATGAQGHRIFPGRRVTGEPKVLWDLTARFVTLTTGFHLTIGDYRDWEAIGAWGRQVAGAIQSRPASAAA